MSDAEISVDIAEMAGEFFVGADFFFDLFAFLKDFLGGFGVLPEVGLGGFFFELFQTGLIGGEVKDSSERW